MKPSELKDRWRKEPELIILNSKLQKLFQHGGTIQSGSNSATLSLVDERIDLRGIRAEQKFIKTCKSEGVDFSHSSFADRWIERSRFVNCRFDNTDFSLFTDHGNVFDDCSFYNCKFNGGAIGYDGSKFLNTRFEKCNFTRTIFTRPEFVSVDFVRCRLKGIDFCAASFEECDFVGELDDVWFRGGFATQIASMQIENFGVPKKNQMKNVSFEYAELHDLTFSDDCDLSTVTIMNSGDYLRFDDWKARLEYLKSEIAAWPEHERKEAEIFANSFPVHATYQFWMIINRDDVERDYGKDIAAKILELLQSWDQNRR